jgi:hypothetical protein
VPAMPVEVVIAPEAELDIAEAYVWYEGRRAGLGEEFLSSVDACLTGIKKQWAFSQPNDVIGTQPACSPETFDIAVYLPRVSMGSTKLLSSQWVSFRYGQPRSVPPDPFWLPV